MSTFKYLIVILYFSLGFSAHSNTDDTGQNLSFSEAIKQGIFNEQPHQFPVQLQSLSLSEQEYAKVMKVYNACLKPLHHGTERKNHFAPRICSAMDNYTYQRHPNHGVKLRMRPSQKQSAQKSAHDMLIEEAKMLTRQEQLSDMEKIMVAKCMAEESLSFFSPTHHPFKGLKESIRASYRSPEAAFFHEEGICTNFSSIMLNVANHIGLAGQVFAARNIFHVYLEVEIDGIWYHTHPLNSAQNNCDLIKFD